jgi:hypothetical protein
MSLKGEGVGELYLNHVLMNYDKTKNSAVPAGFLYSDTSTNEDNSFRNHIRYPKRDFP